MDFYLLFMKETYISLWALVQIIVILITNNTRIYLGLILLITYYEVRRRAHIIDASQDISS